MISEKYLTHLKRARKDFLSSRGHPEDIISKDILDSWIRSRSYSINPDNVQADILSTSQLQSHISQNQILYDIVTYFIEYLYQFVKGSGFMIMFADKSGYILKAIGDDDIMEIAENQAIPLKEGSCRSESVIGTNAIGTPLHTGKPIQIFAYEHYVSLSANWTCSGAPIIMDEEILGVICLSGAWDKIHVHTLGMVMAISEAIARQFYLKLANDKLKLIKNQLQTSIDSLHSGTFLLDEKYNISYVNAMTLTNLEYAKEEMISHSYKEFFPELDLRGVEKNTYDIETVIRGKYQEFQCYISIKFVSRSSYSNRETFLISFRKEEYIKKFVNKVIGSSAHYTFPNIIGSCSTIKRAKELAERVSRGNTNVLITGESGTGKELFAQSIHNNSPFSKGPFVAINCGAIPKELIESELFGYSAGAFTGARKEGRAGKFELANNGTIFLDEIGDMPYEVQVKLLRVLQERCVTRIGAKTPIPLNIRVITATNINLEAAVLNHTFRSDLYYRLNVFDLHIPALRERGDDIFLLTDYFLLKYQNPNYEPITEIMGEVKELFVDYSWPGNIRELENTIERMCILTTNGILSLDLLPANMLKFYQKQVTVNREMEPSHGAAISAEMTIDETEKKLIIEHLINLGGNIKRAAISLGMSRRTLYRKMEKYQIDPNKIRFEIK